MKIVEDTSLYAKLLTSVKVAGRDRPRPLSPIEVSDLIKRMIEEFGTEKEVMERLSIKKDMLKAFRALQDLPEEYKHAVVWGTSNKEGVSFSSAHRIARLKSSELDKKIILDSAIKYEFTRNEIENIITLKHREENLAIEDCIEKVKQIRPTLEVHHLLVIPLPPKVLEKLSYISSSQNEKIETLLRNFISNFIPHENIFSIVQKGAYVVLSLDKTGYEKFMHVVKMNKLLATQIVEFFVNHGAKLNVS